MGNYNKEFEFNIKVQKQLKYDLEKLGIESDEGMEELIIKLLQAHVDSKDKEKRMDRIFS